MPALLDQADGESVPTPAATPAVPPTGSAQGLLTGPVYGPDQGVIEEARRRQRLRRVRLAVGGSLVMVGLGILLWGLGGSGPSAHSAHARAGRGPCSLRAGGLPGLQAEWSHVAAAIRPFPGKLIGRSFFSCIDTEYYLRHWPLDAAILLDAAHPGTPPAAIPCLTPVGGEHGYFNGPGDFKGELTATRVGDAWLVVAGGSGLDQRMQVLRHLTATVKL